MAQRQAQRGNALVAGFNDLVQRGSREVDEFKRDVRRAQRNVATGLQRAAVRYPLPASGRAAGGGSSSDSKGPPRQQPLDPTRSRQSPSARTSSPFWAKTAIDTATKAGQIYGVGRGAFNSIAGLANAGVTTTRLLNPVLDRAFSPVLGQPTAEEQVAGQVRRADDYISDFKSGRRTLKGEVARELHNANVRLNPGATPPAASLSGELRRNFDVGANQGELVADVASIYVGGPGAKVVGRAATAVKPLSEAEYLLQQMAESKTAYMAKPYTGRGHHFVPLRTLRKAEEWLRSRKLDPGPLKARVGGGVLSLGVGADAIGGGDGED